jgi:hypothetical protein
MTKKCSEKKPSLSRRGFLSQSSALLLSGAGLTFAPFNILKGHAKEDIILGHGNFKYKVWRDWGNLDPQTTPVNNCHEMVIDRKGRLILLTDETKNNVIIYDLSGKLLDTWGDSFPGGHGLTLSQEGDEEFLFITDHKLGKVFKTTLDGRVLLEIDHPSSIGVYTTDQAFKPTETAIGPNGDIYIADGYGSQFILQYNRQGEFIRRFGGKGDGDDQFDTCHGVCLDTRGSQPSLICTSRTHNCFKRFTLDGTYLSTIFLPGAFVCRAVIDDNNIYAGVCWSRLRYLNRTDNSGFVTILDGKNMVVSNPGGTKPTYRNGELQLMVQAEPIFKHCHDVCIDKDKNLYVCQWNAGKTYPMKLERI